VSFVDSRRVAVDQLLRSADEAAARGDWSAATALSEAAAAIEPDNPAVIEALSRARSSLAAASASSGTRRRLTLLFCDLAGSTTIASAIDPEEWREILHAYHDTSSRVIRELDGFPAEFHGDGILAYFGYPRAHEDDGLRAVLAGLEIIEAVQALPVPPDAPVPMLDARVGIHTGLTVIDDVGDGTLVKPGRIFGEAPNLAARVQAAAGDGNVVVSADTYALVRDRVVAESLGPHELKGIPRPVELFRVDAVRADTDPGGATDLALVGRREELGRLEAAWAASRRARTYAAIVGEPGIGKSLLARQVVERATADGARILPMRCSALHTNTPLYPVVRLLLSLLVPTVGSPTGPIDQRLGPGGAALQRIAEALAAVELVDEADLFLLAQVCSVPLPPGAHAPDLAAEQARERVLTLLSTWIDRLAKTQPLVLLVEDVQWADPTSLDLLRRVGSGQGAGSPYLLLVTSRGNPESLPGRPDIVLELSPLTEEEADRLVDEAASGRLDRQRRALVVRRSEGVPLYARELARLFAERGSSDAGDEDSSLATLPTLSDLLVARLDAFPEERALIQALAVLGRAGTLSLLASLTGIGEQEVRRQLDHLEAAGIVRRGRRGSDVEFSHGLLARAAYEVQLLADRRKLHRRIATELRSRYATSLDEYVEELAHHHALGGELDAAARLWIQAGTRHASLSAHPEALRSFRLVLEHLDELGNTRDELELAALAGVAASLLATSGYAAPEVGEAYGRLRELAANRDVGIELSSLFGLWSYYHVVGDAVTSLPLAEELLTRARASGDPAAEQAAAGVLGYQLWRLGRPEEARPLLELGRSWEGPVRILPHHPGIGATVNLAAVAWQLGDFACARHALATAIEAAEALTGPGAHFTRAYAHAWAAEHCQLTGDPSAAAAHAVRAVEISTQFGFSSWLGAGLAHQKIAEGQMGSEDAIGAIEFCVVAWRSAGASAGLVMFSLGLALACERAGRVDAGLAAVDQAESLAGDLGEHYLNAEIERVRGHLLEMRRPGDPEARRAFERAVAVARDRGARGVELRARTGLAGTARDEHERAADLAALAELARTLDPSGTDPEPALVEARQLLQERAGRDTGSGSSADPPSGAGAKAGAAAGTGLARR
jgi:class 3 adenylate cyclase/tetratricopeptide (TPR) repeat protein